MRRGNIIQNKFFALLVDHEILRSSEKKAGNEDLVIGDELEQSRDLMDLKERLENSSSYRRSYLTVQVPAGVEEMSLHFNTFSDHRDDLQPGLLWGAGLEAGE